MIIKVKGLRINGGIRADKVRLVDAENNQVGIVERLFAQGKDREANLDLVEVSPTSDPPVCRIMDYGKWVYEQKRKIREARKKTHHTGSLKEVRLRPETDAHDIEIKVKHAREFISKGHKVQVGLAGLFQCEKPLNYADLIVFCIDKPNLISSYPSVNLQTLNFYYHSLSPFQKL